MIDKQSLGALQKRLAQQLDRSQHTVQEGKAWLGVEIADSGWLLPLAQTGEILSWENPLSVPYTKSWYTGVVKSRGNLCGVVDLVSFLKESNLSIQTWSTLAAPPDVHRVSERRIVTLNTRLEFNAAITIDRLHGIRHASAFQSAEPLKENAPDFWGESYVDVRGNTWQEINLLALSKAPHFVDIRV